MIMKELRRYLNGLGACDLKDDVDSLESAIRMMFTPQGREFCIKTGFPTIEFLRKHKDELNTIPGVYIDAGLVRTHDEHEVLAAGDSAVTFYADKPDALYKVIAMHGATAYIRASGYAVATGTDIKGDIMCKNDGTAKVTIER